MQRSLSHQKPLVPFVYLALFVLYNSLCTIYPILPPFFGVLYLLFSRALQKDDTGSIFLLAIALMVYEANFNFMFGSSIIYFYLLHHFFMPKITQTILCKSCIKFLYVALAYIGYFLFLSLIANIFMLNVPSFHYYIIYYIVIEFFIVSLL